MILDNIEFLLVRSVKFVLSHPHASCVCIAGSYIGYIYSHHITDYFGTAPYSSVTSNRLTRALQNILINYSRVNHDIVWYPLDCLETTWRARANNNGHALSGATRDIARKIIFGAISNQGMGAVELSPAACTLPENEDSFITYHAPNDLAGSPKIANIQDSSVIVAIDTDYYLEDPDYILGRLQPTIMYTFNPIHVAGIDGDCRFRIKNNRIIYEVDGGGNWTHQTWDWCSPGEFVRSTVIPRDWKQWFWHRFLRCFGIRCVVENKIHHARPWSQQPHRAIVWTVPSVSYKMFDWVRCDINSRVLKRAGYDEGNGWNRIVFKEPTTGDVMVSIGRCGDDLHVELPKQHLDLVMGCQTPQSVTSRLIGLKYTDSATLALIGQYYSKTATKSGEFDLYVTASAEVPVHWVPESYYDEVDITARLYSSPLISQPALSPMIKRWETLAHALETRVSFVANTVVPPLKYNSYAREFVNLLVPVPHLGIPCDLQETIDQMTKPSQVTQIKQIIETIDVEPRALIESFTKNEPCMKTPRVISAWNDMRWLISVSKYQYRFKDEVLRSEHNEHWFMPGLTPPEIVEKVRDFAANTEDLMSADYSNLDGTVSAPLQRMVPFAAELRYFMPRYHSEIRKYHNQLISAPARSKTFGFKYDPGVGVKSGSPTTTNHNTIINAFHEFCAIRSAFPDLSAKDAYRLIGPKCGDDGISRASIASRISRVVADFGMTLKVEKYDPEVGITFLARVFPDIHNTTSSFQDPLRTIRKLNMTFRNTTVSLADAAIDRLQGYLITDQHTPVISDYCKAVIKYYEPKASPEHNRAKRVCASMEHPYWASENTSWPQAPEDHDLMIECIANRIGLSRPVLEQFIDEMRSPNFDPWHFRRLHPDLDCVYDETLDDDCLPTPKWVDARQTSNSRELIQNAIDNRANPRPTTPDPRTPNRSGDDSGFFSSTPNVSAEGHGSPSGLLAGNVVAFGTSDRQLVVKTNGSQGTNRRGAPGGGRPAARDKQVKNNHRRAPTGGRAKRGNESFRERSNH